MVENERPNKKARSQEAALKDRFRRLVTHQTNASTE
jgi:hypothetical protein